MINRVCKVTLAALAIATLLQPVHCKEENKLVHKIKGEYLTSCLGRHVIDLPSGSTIKLKSMVGGAQVDVRRSVTSDEFKRLVAGHEADLKAIPHRRQGARLKERIELADNRTLFVSWFDKSSIATDLMELYSLMEPQSVMHVFSAQASAKHENVSIEYTRELSANLHYRGSGSIPTRPGFCIDQGLVTLSDVNKEETSAEIRLAGRRGLTMTYTAYVSGAPEKPLLQRLSRTSPGYEGTLAAMKTLRRGDRIIGPIRGQEILVRADDGDKRSYEFLWESQGQEDSIEHPFLSLRMTTTDETDDNGEIMDAPFADDSEALALWDSILETLRLRPGAVITSGADLS